MYSSTNNNNEYNGLLNNSSLSYNSLYKNVLTTDREPIIFHNTYQVYPPNEKNGQTNDPILFDGTLDCDFINNLEFTYNNMNKQNVSYNIGDDSYQISPGLINVTATCNNGITNTYGFISESLKGDGIGTSTINCNQGINMITINAQSYIDGVSAYQCNGDESAVIINAGDTNNGTTMGGIPYEIQCESGSAFSTANFHVNTSTNTIDYIDFPKCKIVTCSKGEELDINNNCGCTKKCSDPNANPCNCDECIALSYTKCKNNNLCSLTCSSSELSSFKFGKYTVYYIIGGILGFLVVIVIIIVIYKKYYS